jgi:anti-sigma B factor antagonist
MRSIASFAGEIDVGSKEEFQESLRRLDTAETAIVDLSKVSYMDSTGISQLIWLYRRRADNGRSAPRLVVSPKITRLFQVSGLGAIFPLFEDLGAAQLP